MRLHAALQRRWAAAAVAFALIVTIVAAVLTLASGRHAAGVPARWGELVVWQALVYGSWVPIGAVVDRLVRRSGLTARLALLLYACGLPLAAAHAAFATGLDVLFSPAARAPEAAGHWAARMPIDLLVYLAVATFVVAVRAQQLAAEAADRAAGLAAALDAARAAAARASPGAAEPPAHLFVSVGSRRMVVDVAEVEWFASAGNYVVVNWEEREGLIRETLSALEQRLDPAVFARSHRSTIVNLARVREAASLADGSWRLVMSGGAELVVSRTYRDGVLERLRR
ncbi:MAG TPA: LytTR family DNA-binding domain-containing protein [Caulobacteraceae bacterium]|nr:LytTR family DNA-binding domain-containing protein [Caulobacteraceae bacterium]